MGSADMKAATTPAERFAALARLIFGAPKEEVDEAIELERQERKAEREKKKEAA